MDLSLAQQRAIAIAKAKVAVQGQDAPDTLTDTIKGAVSGIPQGVLSLAGLPGTIGDEFNNSLSSILGMPQLPQSQVSGAALRADEAAATNGASDYKPQTALGNIAQATTAGAAGGAILGPGSMAANALVGGSAGATSETAGQVADAYAPQYGTAARIAGSLVGPAAVSGVTSLVNATAPMTAAQQAAKNLQQAIDAGGVNQGAMDARMAANTALSPMDVNPAVQHMGMKLASQTGDARTQLVNAVAARQAAAPGEVTAATDAALGNVPNVKTYLDNIKTNAQQNGGQAINQALAATGPVDVGPVLQHIDNVVSPGVSGTTQSGIAMGPTEQALTQLRAKLANDTEQLSDPQRLHTIQSNMRTQADALLSSASGQERLTGKAIADARQKLVSQIDAASGGTYRPAQHMYADDMAVKDGFNKGTTIFDNGKDLENRPEYWQDWVNNATQPVIDAAKLGGRVAFDNQMNSVRNATLKGVSIPEVGFNRARMTALYGQQEADQLAQSMADQKAMALTNHRLTGGSDTAPRLAADELTKITPSHNMLHGSFLLSNIAALSHLGETFGLGGHAGMAAGAGLSAVAKGVNMLVQRRDALRNAIMAHAISGDSGDLQQALSHGGPLLAPTSPFDPRRAALAAVLSGQRQIPQGQ